MPRWQVFCMPAESQSIRLAASLAFHTQSGPALGDIQPQRALTTGTLSEDGYPCRGSSGVEA